MDKDTIQIWAEHFVADLVVGGERVPLDRVIAAHLPTLETLRANGLTWRGIAAIIARAGGRRTSGHPISPDQLRADVSRLVKRQAAAAELARAPAATVPVPVRPAAGPLTPPTPLAATRSKSRASTLSPPACPRSMPPSSSELAAAPPVSISSGGSKDVSDTDIAAALARLKLHS